MQIQSTSDGTSLRATLQGQFNFSTNKEFRQLIDEVRDKPLQSVMIVLADVDFIDSAALGLLLMMRNECQKKGTKLLLKSPKGQVEKVFHLSQFDTMFTIEP